MRRVIMSLYSMPDPNVNIRLDWCGCSLPETIQRIGQKKVDNSQWPTWAIG